MLLVMLLVLVIVGLGLGGRYRFVRNGGLWESLGLGPGLQLRLRHWQGPLSGVTERLRQ